MKEDSKKENKKIMAIMFARPQTDVFTLRSIQWSNDIYEDLKCNVEKYREIVKEVCDILAKKFGKELRVINVVSTLVYMFASMNGNIFSECLRVMEEGDPDKKFMKCLAELEDILLAESHVIATLLQMYLDYLHKNNTSKPSYLM